MEINTLIIESLINSFASIRYVAIYQKGKLLSKESSGLELNSSGESDKYEELIVNPAILTLARQRGNIDCGGLRYVIIGYGNFYQLIKEIKNGHLSICLNSKT